MRPLRYHLRFQIVPGPGVRKDAADLVAFCRRHGIEEVVLFIAAEEWNNGLLSRREEDAWFDTIKVARKILDRAGITVSLNPWMTVLHCDRGRRFPKGRRFQPQVSPSGRRSRACASFVDPAWQRYVFNLYGRFAKLGFRVLWVEDDFRYHNHAPLDWGGGFEPAMLARFSRKAGRQVTRQRLLRAILKPGPPHPWRKLWMATWREVQIEVAKGLAAAVAKCRPSGFRSRLGLMSSHPSTHSVEGRDWQACFESLRVGKDTAVHRPHFAGYSEAPGRHKTYSIMMLDIQKRFRPSDAEVAPEIENFPFTRWSKSDALTWAEMAMCQFHGSDALLLDLFPFSGNRASAEPAIGELLDRSRPGLEWIAARFPKSLATTGVYLPWPQDAQERVRTWAGRSMYELNASPLDPGEFLLPNGIPVTFSPQPVSAVFGSLAWALSDAEWRERLAAGVLLDADSAAILCQRGWSDLIGVRVGGIAGREDDSYALEVVTTARAGVPAGFRMNCNLMERMGQLSPLKGSEEWTTILRPDGTRFGAGLVVCHNRLGGRIATLSAPGPAGLPGSYQRQVLVHSLMSALAGQRGYAATVSGAPHCLPMHFRDSVRHSIVVFNGAPDSATPDIHVPEMKKRPSHMTLLAPLSKPVAARINVRHGATGLHLTPTTPIPYLGFLVLTWR